uniref:CSON001433 protein n=1 Tax=Culicoides sonorensis TaxID=179676 RepID=A0A336MGN2_CULSO
MEGPKYDPENKIWKGAVVPYPFPENSGVVDITLNHMKQNLDWVCQISDDSGEIYTYARVLKESFSLAYALKYKYGVRQGDRIFLYMDFHHYMLPTWYACALAGAVLCPFFHAGEPQDEVAELVATINPVMLISSESKDLTMFDTILNTLNLKIPVLTYNNRISKNDDLKPLFENDVNMDEFPLPKIADPAKDVFILFVSSGTTSRLKLVPITNKKLSLHFIENFPPVRLSFTMRPGWSTTALMAFNSLFSKVSNVVRAEYTIDDFLQMVSKHNVNILFIKPIDIYNALKSKTIENVSLDSVRICFSTGQHLSSKLAEKFEKYLKNSYVFSLYGSSEFGSNITTFSNDKPAIGSVGKIKKNMNLKVINENGENLGPNEIGEICIKSIYADFDGYLQNEKLSKEAVDSDGYLKTGDIGYMDNEANLFLVERKKFLISYRGEWINQNKIEMAVLENIPGCARVCCVDIEDDINGVVPIVVIVPEKDFSPFNEQEIMRVISETHDFPFESKVLFFDSVPLTTSDKVRKIALRTWCD